MTGQIITDFARLEREGAPKSAPKRPSHLEIILARPELVEKHIARHSVDHETGCWNWTGPTRSGGKSANPMQYGVISIRWEGKSVKIPAHRVSYIYANKSDPLGLVLRHKCDNPLCINPEHLEPGTQAQNMQEMVERGRHNCQKRDPALYSKLTKNEARLVYCLAGRLTNTQTAEHFEGRISRSAVSTIRTGKTWTRINPEKLKKENPMTNEPTLQIVTDRFSEVKGLMSNFKILHKCWLLPEDPFRPRPERVELGGRIWDAQRLAVAYWSGEEPEGDVRASCGSPRCVNPDHLIDEPTKLADS